MKRINIFYHESAVLGLNFGQRLAKVILKHRPDAGGRPAALHALERAVDLQTNEHTSYAVAIVALAVPIEYFAGTWHTNIDTYERIIEEETRRFITDLNHRATAPTIRRLKANPA